MHRNQMEKAYASNSPAHLRKYKVPLNAQGSAGRSLDAAPFEEYLDNDIGDGQAKGRPAASGGYVN